MGNLLSQVADMVTEMAELSATIAAAAAVARGVLGLRVFGGTAKRQGQQDGVQSYDSFKVGGGGTARGRTAVADSRGHRIPWRTPCRHLAFSSDSSPPWPWD